MVSALEKDLASVFERIERIESLNQAKVLAAFQNNRVAAHHFNPTTGYGLTTLAGNALIKYLPMLSAPRLR